MGYRRVKISDKDTLHTRQKAAALDYKPEVDHAPRVVAAGQGLIAEQIITLAKENNVPIYEDPTLASALSMVNLDNEIPPELYMVVAEVLAYIYRISGRVAKRKAR